MIALALALAFAAPDPCAGVLDRTAGCAAPDDVAAPVAPDAGAKHQANGLTDVIRSQEIPSKLGLLAAALGIGGTAAMSVTYAVTPPYQTADQERLRKAMRVGGASVIVLAALVAGAAAALAVFDPATGQPRFNLVEDDE